MRCKWTQIQWRYASATETEAIKLRVELETWMRLRMLWTREEHIAQYRFARNVWQLLTPEQQTKLIAGEWKSFAKQDTGHTRGDAAAKIITRAIGKPDNKAAFDPAVATWSTQRLPLHQVVDAAENNERRIVFAMDLNSESMALEANLKATEAYSALYLAEADALRRIVQAGYHNPVAACAGAADEAWTEATTRFETGAAELIQILSTP